MKNNFAVLYEKKIDGDTLVFVDTSKAMIRGIRWNELGEWGRRKFENLLFLTRQHGSKDKLKIIYAHAAS